MANVSAHRSGASDSIHAEETDTDRWLAEVMHLRIAKRLGEIRTQRWAKLLDAAERVVATVERFDHQSKPNHLMKLVARMRTSAAREYPPEYLRDVVSAIHAITIGLEKLSNELAAPLPHTPLSRISMPPLPSEPEGTDRGSCEK